MEIKKKVNENEDDEDDAPTNPHSNGEYLFSPPSNKGRENKKIAIMKKNTNNKITKK